MDEAAASARPRQTRMHTDALVLDPTCGRILDSPNRSRLWAPYEQEDDMIGPPTDEAFACLTAADLFADFTVEEFEALDLVIPARHVARGELLFNQAEPVDALFILKQGRVRIFRVTEEGKALTMAILGPGAVFGEMHSLGQRMYDNFAEAIEDSVVCRLDARDVERHLLSDARIAVRVTRQLGEEISRLEARLTDLAFRPLIARCAAALLALSPQPGASLFAQRSVVRVTHEQLAELLAATREATSKAVGALAAQNLVRQGRGRITVVDPAGLRRIAGGRA